MANDGSAYHVANFISKKIDCTIDVLHYAPHTISKSKLVNRFIVVFSPFENILKTVEEVIQLNAENNYDLIIPINDAALEIAAILRSSLNNVLMHNNDQSDVYRSKISIWQLAARLNLPHLKSTVFNTLTEYEDVRDNIEIPTIFKPNKSAQVVKNRIHKYGVRLANNIQQADNFVYDHIGVMPIMIQEIKSGFGVGLNFFSIKGEIISYYAHQRIVENNGGGVSSLRKTIDGNKFGLLEISRQIIKEMNWTGIGMLEFRVHNEIPYIMELNGRPWGSLMLGEKSGSNPVFDYIKWSLTGEMPIYQGYKLDLVGRKLKEDIKNVAKAALSRDFTKLFTWIGSFRNELFGRGFIEDLFINDPKFAKVYWIPKRKPTLPMPPLNHLQGIKADQKICFVCFGNINRSPFAEKVLKNLLPEIDCISAGIHNLSGRMASRQAIRTATSFNCNLHDHRSKYVGEVDLSNYLLVVMDRSNVLALNNLGFYKNIYSLSISDIEDPHCKSDEVYHKVYSEIVAKLKMATENPV